jgi:hypothetical protein
MKNNHEYQIVLVWFSLLLDHCARAEQQQQMVKTRERRRKEKKENADHQTVDQTI